VCGGLVIPEVREAARLALADLTIRDPCCHLRKAGSLVLRPGMTISSVRI